MLQSFLYHQLAAFSGSIYSQIVLGYRYANHISTPVNIDLAVRMYLMAADEVAKGLSTTASVVNYPKQKLFEEDTASNPTTVQEDVLQYYKYAADRGDISAQYVIGQVYYYGGSGVEQNYSEAFPYLELAARNGHAGAMGLIGQMFLHGHGVQVDYSSALHYFREGAKQNNPLSLHGLGWISWYHPEYTGETSTAAMEYLKKAVELDCPEAAYTIGKILKDSGAKGAPTSYFEKAARHGKIFN